MAQNDNRFWRSAENIEADVFADQDFVRFRRRLKRMGYSEEVIAEREDAICENYVAIYGYDPRILQS